MGEIREITELFGRSFRLLREIETKMGDDFLKNIFKKEIENFRISFTDFLKNLSAVRLNCQVKNVMNVVSIASHLKLVPQVLSLLLEKELLKLEIFAINFAGTERNLKKQPASVFNTTVFSGKEDQRPKLNNFQKKLLEFISTKPEVKKTEILESFKDKSERNIRRAIGSLMCTGLIQKKKGGNKPSYSKTPDNN